VKNPPRSLLRAIRKAAYGSAHVSHGARHGGIAPDPNIYAPLVPAAISHGGINKDDYDNGESSVAWGFVRADVPDWVKEDFALEQIQDFQPYTIVRKSNFSNSCTASNS
jgi:hypothetical protein